MNLKILFCAASVPLLWGSSAFAGSTEPEAERLLVHGRKLFDTGKHRESIALCDKLLAEHPGSSKADDAMLLIALNHDWLAGRCRLELP